MRMPPSAFGALLLDALFPLAGSLSAARSELYDNDKVSDWFPDDFPDAPQTPVIATMMDMLLASVRAGRLGTFLSHSGMMRS